MKLPPVLLALLTLFAAEFSIRAQEALPPEVATARTRFEADLEASAKPLRQRYVSQLEEFKRSATLRNDLKAANAIDAEIKRVDVQAGAVAGRDLKHQLKGTAWQWNPRLILRFDGDTATTGIWTVDVKYNGGQATLTLRPPANLAGKQGAFTFDDSLQAAAGTDFDGTPHKLTRVK